MSRKGEIMCKQKDRRREARCPRGYDAPAPVDRDRRKVRVFCEEWLRFQRTRIRESTYVKYETVLRNHILPGLGDRSPAELDAQMIEAFTSELLRAGLSVQSVRNILMELRAILRHAAARYPGLFPDVPVPYPKAQRREMRVLDRSEQARLVDCLLQETDACKFGILLAFATGLRIGEICALRWENISLRDGTLRVRATMQRLRHTDGDGPGRTRILIGSPKSCTSVRTIPLPKRMVCLCEKYDPKQPSAYVLTGAEDYMEPRRLQRRLEKYTKACGLEGVHFHTLRHTFATRCMEVGFEIKSLSEILGHASATTTLDRYVHSSLDLKRVNMEKLIDCSV